MFRAKIYKRPENFTPIQWVDWCHLKFMPTVLMCVSALYHQLIRGLVTQGPPKLFVGVAKEIIYVW